MAAAIIPIVATAVQLVIPLIPSVISLVETVFGPKNGDAKKAAAVDLLKSGLTAVANAGKLPSAAVLDPSLPNALADAVQRVFDDPKLNPLQQPQATAAAPAPAKLGPVLSMHFASGFGRGFLVIEVPPQ